MRSLPYCGLNSTNDIPQPGAHSSLASCKGIRIPESGKFLLVEPEIWENLTRGTWNAGLWNPEFSSRNPESH